MGERIPARRASFEVARFESYPISLRDSPWFFLLVLRVSSTRTRTRRYGNEYEYHFIEYEYEGNPECATSKRASEGIHVEQDRSAEPLLALRAGSAPRVASALRAGIRSANRSSEDVAIRLGNAARRLSVGSDDGR